MSMSKSERDDLARLARQRARLAKTDASHREKVLLAEIEDELSREYDARDRLWADAVVIAEEAAAKANAVIEARCLELGIPATHAPLLRLGWQARSPSLVDRERRSELRQLAKSRLTALTASAKTQIDRQALETETTLIAGGLESDEARQFLAAMPTAEQLMPAVGLDDLGVTIWQPPDGAAGELLAPSTPADLERRQQRRALERIEQVQRELDG